MMSTDFACKLLAYTYVIGGEATVLHEGMNAGIAIASQKLNIKGGEIPKAEYMVELKKRILQLDIAIAGFASIKEHASPTELTKVIPWLKEIWDRYDIDLKTSQSKPIKNHTTK